MDKCFLCILLHSVCVIVGAQHTQSRYDDTVAYNKFLEFKIISDYELGITKKIDKSTIVTHRIESNYKTENDSIYVYRVYKIDKNLKKAIRYYYSYLNGFYRIPFLKKRFIYICTDLGGKTLNSGEYSIYLYSTYGPRHFPIIAYGYYYNNPLLFVNLDTSLYKVKEKPIGCIEKFKAPTIITLDLNVNEKHYIPPYAIGLKNGEIQEVLQRRLFYRDFINVKNKNNESK